MTQEQAVDSLMTVESQVARKKLEERINQLEEEIQQADVVDSADSNTASRSELEQFTTWLTDLMEHPVRILKDPSHIEAQRAVFEIVFGKIPIYEEIANGTAKLSPLFRLKSDSGDSKSVSVPSAEFDWKQISRPFDLWRRFGDLLG